MIKIFLFRLLLTVSLAILLGPCTVLGQSAELDSNKVNRLFKNNLRSCDLSSLWFSATDDIIGFIDSNYQRLQIHYSSITKDKKDKNIYWVKGRTKIKDNIRSFDGYIMVIDVKEDDSYNAEGELYSMDTTREGNITATYSFFQDVDQPGGGVFQGVLNTQFFMNRFYKIFYDTLDLGDNYSNNLFVGNWTRYDGKVSMICNWGDDRPPNCGDLDGGVGEFAPNERYRKNGWEGYCWYCDYETIEKYKANKKLSEWWK